MGLVTGLVAAAAVGAAATAITGKQASDAQARSAKNANNTQLYMYNQTRDDQAPYRQAGYAALSQLQDGTADGGDFNRDFTLADFQKDPGYQFRLSEGLNTLQNSAAAAGGLLSGNTLKAITDYGQEYASNEYSNAYNRFNQDRTQRFNRLASISGIGQTATNSVNAAGQNAANNIAANQTAVGNAQAASYVNTGNAVNNGISSLGNFYLQNQYLKGLQQRPVAYYGTPTGAGTPGYSTAGLV